MPELSKNQPTDSLTRGVISMSCTKQPEAKMSGLQRCAASDFFESGSNPVLQIVNANPIRIRYQLDSSNPNPV